MFIKIFELGTFASVSWEKVKKKQFYEGTSISFNFLFLKYTAIKRRMEQKID